MRRAKIETAIKLACDVHNLHVPADAQGHLIERALELKTDEEQINLLVPVLESYQHPVGSVSHVKHSA